MDSTELYPLTFLVHIRNVQVSKRYFFHVVEDDTIFEISSEIWQPSISIFWTSEICSKMTLDSDFRSKNEKCIVGRKWQASNIGGSQLQ